MKITGIVKSVCLAAAVVLAAAAVLVSCGEESPDAPDAEKGGSDGSESYADVSADAVLDAAVAAFSEDELPKVKYYRSSVTDPDSDEYLDPDFAGQFFLNEFGAEMPAFTSLSEYAICAPASKKAFEMIVFKLGEASDAAEAKKLMETRFSLKNSGDFGTYVPEEEEMMKNMQIIEKGSFICLLCTSDNARAISAIDAVLGG